MWFDTMVSAFSPSLREEHQDRGLFSGPLLRTLALPAAQLYLLEAARHTRAVSRVQGIFLPVVSA